MPPEDDIASPAPDAARGRRLGRYELRAKLADGGMAEVYVGRRVEGPGAGEVVAIKTIRDQFARNKVFVTMFMDEAKIVSRLRHPNIIRYFELASEGGQLFLAMEFLFGQSLWSTWEACRARGVRLRYDMVAWIGARVADGLHYAHELADEGGRPLGIVHRDVNATNIFVTYDGEIKVIDFGLAKAANRASKTAAGVIKGKVAYMSPEQALGAEVDRRTDIFALGTTLWEICCDRRLFKGGSDIDTIRRVHAADVPDPRRLVDGFPPELWRVLRRALARERSARYGTAAEFARDLDALFADAGVNARSVATVMRELFAEDHARQTEWVTDASGPKPSRSASEPFKPPSTSWIRDEIPAAPVAAPSTPPTALASRPPRSLAHRETVAFALIAVAIVVALVIFAIAYR